ncbi:hypothetical protein [Bacillus sp. ISL-7]|uniref:hypothetical protein n=1 Tax=Bacillus sp. ISL-7 TaxID=2819136 RepID=UPI001BE64F38|nr:hypothetical protein [Bacillus sp. ISL-7]MBT2735149.1 hypothetical protein [Bacillus sp. ISL-7]
MRIGDRLSKEQKQQLNKMVSNPKPRKAEVRNKPKPKKQEKVDWADIMGTKNRGLRRKKGGAWSN